MFKVIEYRDGKVTFWLDFVFCDFFGVYGYLNLKLVYGAIFFLYFGLRV